MTKVRVFVFILTLIVVGTIGYLVSLYARGYRFDGKSLRFSPNGLLVATSDPNGGSVLVNGELKTATNTTISLAPGTYDVEIKKEGFMSWKKRLNIEKEVVSEANASLFRLVPSLTPVTFIGSANPVASSDFTKIAYAVYPENGDDPAKVGLWVMETLNLPFGFAKEPRRVTDGDLSKASWLWSPDRREILLTNQLGVFLLDSGQFTPQSQRVNVASRLEEIKATWEEENQTKLEARLRNLPAEHADAFTRKVRSLAFSPDETKILYIASGSATLKPDLVKQLPGASTQKQEREIKEGQIYIYDIKEDRNFLIEQDSEELTIEPDLYSTAKRSISWFPTSSHLVLAEEGKVTIMDYDGTNRQPVYTGSFVPPYAFPFASTGRLLILTNLGADSSLPNLYSVTIK
jgi:hypothetical protein